MDPQIPQDRDHSSIGTSHGEHVCTEATITGSYCALSICDNLSAIKVRQNKNWCLMGKRRSSEMSTYCFNVNKILLFQCQIKI